MFNGIEDPRVNIWEAQRLPGAKEYLDAAYRDAYPREPKEMFDDSKVYPHVQFVLGVIHHWFYGEEHPSIKNKNVLTVLRKTREKVVEIYNTHAGKTTIFLRDKDTVVLESAAYGRQIYDLPRPGQIRVLKRDDIGSLERVGDDHILITTALGRETVELPKMGEKITKFICAFNLKTWFAVCE